VALERAGLPVTAYYACEIDKHAIKVSQKNYPDIVHLGDVRTADLPEGIDLLIGGSPCQDLSIAKKDRKGLEGDRSGLFWEYVRILREVKPKWFVLENVASMPKKDKDIITAEMGVEPVMFNAALFSAQSRKRLFWTNIQFELPPDRGIRLQDILQPDAEVDESMVVNRTMVAVKKENEDFNQIGYFGATNSCGVGGQALRVYDTEKKATTSGVGLYKIGHVGNTDSQTNRVYSPEGKAPTQCKGPNGGALPTLIKVGHVGATDSQGNRVYSSEGKSVTLSATSGGLGPKTGLYDVEHRIRKLTPIECERLQGLPDNYTDNVAKTHRYKCVGNAFNVDVVAHILTPVS
jgi:DNA (cytosine-5)-methyltransferase 3A